MSIQTPISAYILCTQKRGLARTWTMQDYSAEHFHQPLVTGPLKSQKTDDILCPYKPSYLLCTQKRGLARTWMMQDYSDAHFHQSLVTGPLESRKTDSSNSHQELGLISIQFLWSCVKLFLQCRRQAHYCFSRQIQALGRCKTRLLTSASGLQGHHVLAEVNGHV